MMRHAKFLLFLIVLLAFSGCKRPEKEKENIVRPVKIFHIKGPESFAERTFPGKVEASEKADLSFQLAGELVQLPVKEGDEVSDGQLIAEIEPTNYKIAVEEAKSKWELADIELQRTTKLLAKQFASQAEYDANKTAADAAKARLDVAEENLKDTKIKAPFKGEIAKRYVENYQNVQSKQPVVRLQNRDQLDVEIQIPESLVMQSDRFKKAQYEVEFETSHGTRYQAKVKEVATKASEDTQTYTVTLTLPNPKNLMILPGMTAVVHVKAEVISPQQESLYVIPATAVFSDEKGKTFVWLISLASHQLEKREISIKRLQGTTVLVNRGLVPGEIIVAAGVDFLKEGELVKPFKQSGE